MMYRVLDAHPEVRKSIGLDDGQIFLAKGSGSAVYLIDGKIEQKKIVGERLVFPSAALYHTYFLNFVPIRHFTDDAIENTIARGEMLPAPGTLIKQPGSPQVYVATLGRLLRPIENETVAKNLFGGAWNQKIFDMIDAQFYEYQIGPKVGALTRLTELDTPPLSTESERFRVARLELAARTNRDLDVQLRDIYRQILAKRYLNIFVAWERETGGFPPSPHSDQEGIRPVRLGTVMDDGTVGALTQHSGYTGAIKYVQEEACAGTICFAFIPDTQGAPCGIGASPFTYGSTGKDQFALDFCIESEEGIITIPEVAIEIHQRTVPKLQPGWYRFTERGLKEL